MIARHVCTCFQEMYQRAVKIAWVIEENDAESPQIGLAKRRFSSGGSRAQENKRYRKFNSRKTGRGGLGQGKASYVGVRNEALQSVWAYTFWLV